VRRAEMDDIGARIVPVAIALFAISIVARGIRIVQQAQTMIIERLGKYHRTLSSGVNLIIPIIDKPRAIDWHQVIVTPAGESLARHFRTDKIDLRETVYVFPRQNVITKDNVGVELKDINPPRDIRDAMEKQMRAERDRRAAILTAEAEKQSRILQAEGIRQSEINQAEGQKQAKILAAEAEANARLKVAEAEAQA